jgi:signal transduction histidine kinase
MLFKQAIDDVRPFVELRKQTLQLDAPEPLGTMNLDLFRIRDCVNHLLLNAIKFTPDGGRVTLRAARQSDGSLRLSVSDTGCGIDQQSLARVFEPFFTGFDVAHHSSGIFEHGRKGLGLGLSVVKSFIELHGGTIGVSSEVGKGSTFTVTIPDIPVAPAMSTQ